MLEKQALFFCKLRYLDDKLEGRVSEKDLERKNEQIRQIFSDDPKIVEELLQREEIFNKLRVDNALGRGKHIPLFGDKDLFQVNSWHINEQESLAMWKVYSKTTESIAIESNFKNLSNSLTATSKQIRIGKVEYSNYEDAINDRNVFPKFFIKRKAYEYEQELRALCVNMEDKDVCGENLPTDISILISKVNVNPEAPDWFYELVQAITKKYGYNFEVIKSRLGEEPIF